MSQFTSLGRPCGASDSCNYKLTIDEGPCPAICVDPLTTWYPDSLEGAFTVNGSGLGFTPSDQISGSTNGASNDYQPDAGWAGGDELWQINVSQDAVVTFSGCGAFGFDGRTAIFNCAGDMVARDDNDCGDTAPVFTANLEVISQPYYLLIDSFDSKEKGIYVVTMSY